METFKEILQRLQLEKATFDREEAECRAQSAKYDMYLTINQLRPSYQMPCAIRRDGSRWLCIAHTAQEFLDSPLAYGDSPAQAMINFDHLWNGTGIPLNDDYPRTYNDGDDDDDDPYQEVY